MSECRQNAQLSSSYFKFQNSFESTNCTRKIKLIQHKSYSDRDADTDAEICNDAVVLIMK